MRRVGAAVVLAAVVACGAERIASPDQEAFTLLPIIDAMRVGTTVAFYVSIPLTFTDWRSTWETSDTTIAKCRIVPGEGVCYLEARRAGRVVVRSRWVPDPHVVGTRELIVTP